MSIRISQRFGRYRRIMPLRFSLFPAAGWTGRPWPCPARRSLSWWANAVVVRDADARAGRQRREHVFSCAPTLSPAVLSGTTRCEPWSSSPPRCGCIPLSDDAVALAERAPAVGLRRARRWASAGDRGERDVLLPPCCGWPSRYSPAFPKRPTSVDGLEQNRPATGRAADEQRRPAAAQIGHLRPQAVVRQPVGLSISFCNAGPWPRLRSFRPVRAGATRSRWTGTKHAQRHVYLDLDDTAFSSEMRTFPMTSF